MDAAGVGLSLGASSELLDSGLQTVCSTSGAHDGEALQAELGEGPSYTAHRTGEPVQVADLEFDDSWPAFANCPLICTESLEAADGRPQGMEAAQQE